ncbi:GOLPH3/VPS74 family protein [Saccharopolyspora dendranthemae]|uniref:Golgi phosphoprotein 3 GPP34 n=1 Tax=Saccharopolyspora dendranthemae TaxID=1181886 RepID=A0A561U238_9PSEU|nr:GPP34 family phosphoprotein [Saccharopolyspora dendranthemae]TWF93390.1 Golgi phosphoprotein 3 GPP34 [Saccharopolyspora dendranthemae]
MHHDTLIVEGLMLLLLHDEHGTIAGAGTLHYTLGGAMLVELALRGAIDAEEGRASLNGPEVRAVGDVPIEDPLLRSAYDAVAQKTQRVQPLLLKIGGGLREPVIDRLVERGLVRREEKRVLGVFRSTRWPAEDSQHEADLLEDVRAVLEDGSEPDSRTAAVIALLSSSGALPTLHPTPKWSSRVATRAKEIEQGSWGASAVNAAVTRTAAAIAASSAAVSVAVIAGVQ